MLGLRYGSVVKNSSALPVAMVSIAAQTAPVETAIPVAVETAPVETAVTDIGVDQGGCDLRRLDGSRRHRLGDDRGHNLLGVNGLPHSFDDGVEARYRVGGVLDDPYRAIGLGERVRASHHVALAHLALRLIVTGDRVVYGVVIFIIWHRLKRSVDQFMRKRHSKKIQVYAIRTLLS